MRQAWHRLLPTGSASLLDLQVRTPTALEWFRKARYQKKAKIARITARGNGDHSASGERRLKRDGAINAPIFGQIIPNRSRADPNSVGQFSTALARGSQGTSRLRRSKLGSRTFPGGCGVRTSGWACLRLLVGPLAIVALSLAPPTKSPAQDLDLMVKQFLQTLKGTKDAKKLSKQRPPGSPKARSRDPDEASSISQDDYEGKVADLISYMRSDALNDTTNPIRRDAALIASVERHKQIAVPKRMEKWACDIRQIGVSLDPFTDRANSQEPIGFQGGRGQGLFCDGKISYLLVLDRTRANQSRIASLSAGQSILFSGAGVGRRIPDMRTIVRVDQVIPMGNQEAERSPSPPDLRTRADPRSSR
jgi:hypothetical protein